MDPVCHHGIENPEVSCGLCRHSPFAKPRRPSRLRDVAPVRVDPEAELAAEVAEGITCPRCHFPVKGGCPCSRREVYDQDIPAALDWLEDQVAQGNLVAKQAAGIAFGAHRRAWRRAGEWRDPCRVPVPIGDDDERADIMGRFEVDPRWTPFRRSEANHLPV